MTKKKNIFALQREAEAKIKAHFSEPAAASGVYYFFRHNTDRGTDCVYVGQSKNLRRRTAEHFLEYDHIGRSLNRHELYDKDTNPSGWHCYWEEVPQGQLDRAESELIEYWLRQDNTELYNITSGGQGAGKVDINQRAERRGYYTGKQEGYEKAYSEIGKQIERYTTGLKSKGGKIADRKTQELINKLKGETE